MRCFFSRSTRRDWIWKQVRNILLGRQTFLLPKGDQRVLFLRNSTQQNHRSAIKPAKPHYHRNNFHNWNKLEEAKARAPRWISTVTEKPSIASLNRQYYSNKVTHIEMLLIRKIKISASPKRIRIRPNSRLIIVQVSWDFLKSYRKALSNIEN